MDGFEKQNAPEDSVRVPWEPYYGGEPTPTPDPGVDDLKTAKKHFSRLGLGIFLILLVTMAAQLALMVGLEVLLPGWMEHPWGIWLANFLPMYLIAVPVGLLVLRTVPANAPEQRTLRPGQCFKAAAISIFMMYAGSLVGNFVAQWLYTLLGITVENPVEDLVMGSSLIPRVLFTVILAPILEEYIFRKQLIDRARIYGGKLAVIASALIFGLFHGNLSQLFYAASLGLVFGYVYLNTGKLRYSIGLHMLINFMGGVLAPLFLEHLPELENAELSDLTALGEKLPWVLGFSAYTYALLGIGITGLVLLCVSFRKLTFTPAELLPKGKRFRTVCLNAGVLLLLLGCLGEIVLSLL